MDTKRFTKMRLVIIIGVLGVIGVGYFLVSPLFITTEVDESISDLADGGAGVIVFSTGLFVDGDSSHHATGTAKALRDGDAFIIRLEDDFEVTNGPDLFVYLGKDGEYDKEARLGKLKGSKGGQNYIVPSEIDATQYNEVWIWCRAFGVKFGSAHLIVSP